MKMSNFARILPVAIAAALTLAAGAGATAASGGPKNQIKMFMLCSGVDADAQGRIVVVTNKAQSFFTIQVQGMDPMTSYDVVVDGAIQETLTTNAGGEGRVVHRSKQHGAPLPYDPRSTTVDVALTGTVLLSAEVPATPQEAHALVDIRFDLTPGVSVLGRAHADFRSRFGRMKFDVEIENAVPGTFDLMVGGATVGTITVDASGRGRIEFDTRPSTDSEGGDGLDQLMTFDPRGQTVEIQQTTVAMFSGTFPLVP